MPTFFEKKQLVTPGELLAEGDYLPGENTFVENSKIYASRIGLVDSRQQKSQRRRTQSILCAKNG